MELINTAVAYIKTDFCLARRVCVWCRRVAAVSASAQAAPASQHRRADRDVWPGVLSNGIPRGQELHPPWPRRKKLPCWRQECCQSWRLWTCAVCIFTTQLFVWLFLGVVFCNLFSQNVLWKRLWDAVPTNYVNYPICI